MSGRLGGFIAAVVASVGFVPVALAGINGPCTASINAQSVAGNKTITVERHSTPAVAMSSAKAITNLKVKISFAGFSWTVHNEPTSGSSWSKSVNVDKYAKYGVGLYKVTGESSGSGFSCSGSALVKVKGSALSTWAGKAGLIAAVVGVLGAFAAGFVPLGRLLFGPFFGLIAGAGIVVLLQEAAVMYPTRTVAVVGLAAGAAGGVIGPRLLGVLKP